MNAPGSLLTPDLGAPLNQGRDAWFLALPHTSGGGRLVDLMGQSHGKLIGMSATTKGWRGATRKGGFAQLRFDGTTGYVDFGSKQYISSTKPFTIACWVYVFEFTTEVFPRICGVKAVDAAGMSISLNSNNAGYRPVTWGNSTVWTPASSLGFHVSTDFSSALVKTWAHLALTYNGAGSTTAGNYVLYYNGDSQTTVSSTGYSSVGNVNYIGATGDLTRYHNGFIDDFGIWGNRALTASEVRQLMQASNAGYPRELLRLPRAGTVYGPVAAGTAPILRGSILQSPILSGGLVA